MSPPSTGPAPPPRTPAAGIRWRVLLLLVLIGFVAYLLRSNMSVAGERMMDDLGLSQMQLGIVLAAFAWGYALFQLPGGVLGEWLGGRKALALLLLAWAGVNTLVAVVPGTDAATPLVIVGVLVALRFAMGAAQAPLFPITGAMISRWFPPNGWALPNGLTNTGLTLGSAATGPLIAWLAGGVGWRLSFVLTAPIAVLLTVLWWWYARDRPEEHPAVGEAERASIRAGRGAEAEATPGEWTVVLRDRNVLLITLSYFLSNYVFYFFFNWLYVYLVDVRRFAALEGGAMAAAPWVVGALGAFLGGWTCDRLSRQRGIRHGSRVVSLTGLLLAGVFILAAASATSPYVAVVWLSLCLASQQFTDSAAWAATTSVGGRHAAAACGVLNTGGNVVGGVGALLVPFTARELGWPVALGSAALFALLGAILWCWIRADEVIGGPAEPRPGPLASPGGGP